MTTFKFLLIPCIIVLFFLTYACGGNDSSGKNEKESFSSDSSTEYFGMEEDAIAQQGSKYLYVAAFAGLNLRAEPSTSGAVLDRLTYGQQVELIQSTGIDFESNGFSGKWVEVNFNGKNGFLFDGFLLPVEAPGFNPPATLSEYFREQLQPIGPEIPQKNVNNTGNDHRDWLVITEEEMEIQGESDFFRKFQKFAGGYILYEEFGYEYHAFRGFFPGLSLQQGFLLARAMYPKFFAFDECYLDLASIHLPKENKLLKGSGLCSFKLEVGKNKKGKGFITIVNDEMGYTGLEIKESSGGIEIKHFYAL